MSTPEEILQNKEARAERQSAFLEKYELPIISYTLNIPGTRKQSVAYHLVHEVGLHYVSSLLPIVFQKKYILTTGSEALLCCPLNALSIKTTTTGIEELHPLGRLFDMDVIDSQGRRISRRELGVAARKCYICDEDAMYCARSRKHSVQQLECAIQRLINGYYASNFGKQSVPAINQPTVFGKPQEHLLEPLGGARTLESLIQLRWAQKVLWPSEAFS